MNALKPRVQFIYFLSILNLIACGSRERIDDQGALASEIKSKKIIRVTEQEQISALYSTGLDAAGYLNQKFADLSPAVSDCPDSTFLAAQLPEARRVVVSVQALFASDTTNQELFPIEIELLKAYYFQSQTNTDAGEHLQKISDSLSIYYLPITNYSEFLKNCARAMESPFAVWRIVLNQKEVIRSLN